MNRGIVMSVALLLLDLSTALGQAEKLVEPTAAQLAATKEAFAKIGFSHIDDPYFKPMGTRHLFGARGRSAVGAIQAGAITGCALPVRVSFLWQ